MAEDLAKQLALVRELKLEVNDVRGRLAGLQAEYRRTGGEIKRKANDDITRIHQARMDAERLVSLIRGGALFGRYSKDADTHLRVANSWRLFSVAVLVLTGALLAAGYSLLSLRGADLGLVSLPFLLLFAYSSLESNNHRRREFDRRRIALRMSAVEVYTEQWPRNDQDKERADSLIDEFIREHFIHPQLDSNDMSYMGPQFSLFRLVHRR